MFKVTEYAALKVSLSESMLTYRSDSPISFLQEAIAMARLKRDILQVTGNVHFYKAGNAYVVFQVDKDKQSSATCEEKQEPHPESSA